MVSQQKKKKEFSNLFQKIILKYATIGFSLFLNLTDLVFTCFDFE